jgi:hypothetical protein
VAWNECVMIDEGDLGALNRVVKGSYCLPFKDILTNKTIEGDVLIVGDLEVIGTLRVQGLLLSR